MTGGDFGDVAALRGTHRVSPRGLLAAVGDVWRPLAWVLIPLVYGAIALMWQYIAFGAFGFDFVGTVWEPARAVIDGHNPFPPPTRAAVELGNPAVYPPLIPVVAAPLGLLSVFPASVVWALVLLGALVLTFRMLGVRDWRCYLIAATSLPVLGSVYFGNLTVLLLVPLAAAWRYRDRAALAGLSVGVAVAAKLFIWPIIVWLLLTRRFRAALWATFSASGLVLLSWAVIGFDGFLDYPALLQIAEDVYAVRSYSIATIASGFGAPAGLGGALGVGAGLALLVLATWLFRQRDGDRRSFTAAVAACVAASPIVWPYYAALIFVPIAIRWPRITAAWFFGHVMVLMVFLPSYSYPKPEPCCRPADVPRWVWAVSHTEPEPWQALGMTIVVAVVVVALVRLRGLRRSGTGAASSKRLEPVRAEPTQAPRGPNSVPT